MKQIFVIFCFNRLKFVSNRWVTKQTGILPYSNTRPRDELAQLVIGVRGRMVIKMRIVPIKSINKYSDKSLISLAEDEYHSEIMVAVDGILNNCADKPIILISGPSGSGKTGTSLRIKDELIKKGMGAYVLSLDDYFHPLGQNESTDLESPNRLDIPLLSNHLEKILNFEEIIVPSFDFKNQVRKEGRLLKRGREELVIFEGIHALNPEITGTIGAGTTTKIYVSVRTRLQKADNALLHPSKIRLMRRLVRDKLFRGRELYETFSHYDSVERGERLYIMPYKKLADYDIDTFMAYETSVYKHFLLNNLKTVNIEAAEELTAFLSELNDIEASNIPGFSLIREFIGGHDLM